MLRTIGRLVFIAGSSAVVAAAGGGRAFLRRPVGLTYLTLWVAWWLATALGRPAGVPSTYNRKQRTILALGSLTLVGFVVVPPWEYAHRKGPIPRDGRLARLGLALFALGIALQSAAMWALQGRYTSRLGVQPGHRLVTSGPYRFVRHPGYLSNVLSLAGAGLALSSLAGMALAASTVPLILWRIKGEEEMLVAEFGEAYRAYARRTKRLIPLVY